MHYSLLAVGDQQVYAHSHDETLSDNKLSILTVVNDQYDKYRI